MSVGGEAIGALHLFGPARLAIQGRWCPIRGVKQGGLLTVLAMARGHAVHADRLVSAIWADDDLPDPVPSLRVHLSQLRRLLDDAAPGGRRILEGRYPMYRLTPELTTDADLARALRSEALDHLDSDPRRALGHLAEATALVAGEPLPELRSLPFASSATLTLDDLRLAIEDDHAELLVRLDGVAAGTARARELAQAEPTREPRWLHLARALATDGQTAQALSALEEHVEQVRLAHGVAEPSARVQQLRADLRAGAGHLTWAAAPTHHRSPLPSTLARHLPGVWVGRERELAELDDERATFLVDRTLRAIEVVGPGGIGKSALAARFAAQAASDGFEVRHLAWSRSAGSSLRPLAEAGLLDSDHRGSETTAALIVDRIRALGDDQPLLLVIDDVHWAAGTALDALRAIGAHPDLPAMVVVLRRPEPRGVPWRSADMGYVRELRLGLLATAEVERLVTALRTSGGTGEAAVPVAPWIVAAVLEPDQEARGVQLRAGLLQLDPEERTLVEVLSLEPDGLPLTVLATITARPPMELLAQLHLLESDGLVVDCGTARQRFTLCHELVASEVRSNLGGSHRTALATTVHDALELCGEPPSARLRHALAALDVIGPRSGATVAACVEELMASGLYRDVVELAETGEGALGLLDSPARAAVAAAVLYARAAVGEEPTARDALLDVALEAADLGSWDVTARALALRARLGHEFSRDHEELVALTKALDVIDDAEPRLRFELLELLFSALLHAGEPVETLQPVEHQASAVATGLALPSPLARASLMHHQVLTLLGAPPRQWRATSRQTLRHARAAGDRALEMRAQVDLAVDALSLHDLDATATTVEVLATAADPHARWVGLLGRASLALGRGDLDDGLRRSDEAARFGDAHGLIGTFDAQVAQQLLVHWTRGTLPTFLPVMASVDWKEPSRSIWGAALALGLVLAEQADDAASLVRSVVRHLDQGGFAGWQDNVVWALLAEAAHLSGAADVAPRVLAALDRWSGGRTIVGLAADLGPVDRYLAMAHADLAHLDQAASLLAGASAQAGNELWRQRVDLDRAQLLHPSRMPTGNTGLWIWRAA